MLFALVNDVMPQDNKEFAFGVAYLMVYLSSIILSLIGVFIARSNPGAVAPVLYYITALSIACFLVLFKMKPLPPKSDVQKDRSFLEPVSDSESEGSAAGVAVAKRKGGFKKSLLGPCSFACEHRSLLYLCLCVGFVCLPEITLADVGHQFIYEELNLLHGHNRAEKQMASLLSTYPGLLATLPAYYLAGLIAKRIGALALLRCFIPVAACMMAFPVLLTVFPYMWFVPIQGISIQLTMVIFTPLQTLNAQLAPEGHVGEAMAAFGVSKQIAAICANIGVRFGVPWLQRRGMTHIFRWFFPFAGCLCMVALLFAGKIEAPAHAALDPTPASASSENASSEEDEEDDEQE